MAEFHVFLLFPATTSFTDEEDYSAFVSTQLQLIERAYYQSNAILYYHEDNFKHFVDDLSVSSGAGEFYLVGDPNLLFSILTRIEITPEPDNELVSAIWNVDAVMALNPANNEHLTTTPAQFTNTINAILHLSDSTNAKCLLLPINACVPHLTRNNRQISSFWVIKDRPRTHNPPCFIEIPFASDLDNLHTWFRNNQPQRRLNATDPRHNEQSTNYISGKSPLLHDIWRNDDLRAYVQQLLNTALSGGQGSDLVNYDTQHNAF
ncbi:MAG TPA: hypothetical protein PK715_12580, partial [Chitinophagales bacterium]|nr:hypothetical protein [Chitinophagales bacterium]